MKIGRRGNHLPFGQITAAQKFVSTNNNNLLVVEPTLPVCSAAFASVAHLIWTTLESSGTVDYIFRFLE